ncbi:MAG TPA: ABC transporter permease [Thermoanaerobaculia bacterium]|nr:ABC transporter permease [Thermoanaerobaculia bacterium]
MTAAGWLGTVAAASRKELTVMVRYPVAIAANFIQILLMVVVFTIATLMFAPGGTRAGSGQTAITGIMIYGFVLFIFLTDTLWTVGYAVRREQLEGTLDQLVMAPGPRSAHLVSRVVVSLLWTGLLCGSAVLVMRTMVRSLPLANTGLAALVLALSLAGTFGVGFAFAALVLRVQQSAQVWATVLQFLFMLICAPFFPFRVMPAWLRGIVCWIPLAQSVDAFRSVLMGLPRGFPELGPLSRELWLIAAFAVSMPALGLWLYAREERRARELGTLGQH